MFNPTGTVHHRNSLPSHAKSRKTRRGRGRGRRRGRDHVTGTKTDGRERERADAMHTATMQKGGKRAARGRGNNNDDDGDETEHGSVNVPGDGLSEGLGSEGAMMTKVTKLIYCADSFREEYDVTMAACGRLGGRLSSYSSFFWGFWGFWGLRELAAAERNNNTTTTTRTQTSSLKENARRERVMTRRSPPLFGVANYTDVLVMR